MISSNLPVGALVVSKLPNYEVVSFADHDADDQAHKQSLKWNSNKLFQRNQFNALGLFMKIDNVHNTWKRLNV
ncbi:unnamed protein product, partial [Schistosoma turkestanicum]